MSGLMTRILRSCSTHTKQITGSKARACTLEVTYRTEARTGETAIEGVGRGEEKKNDKLHTRIRKYSLYITR